MINEYEFIDANLSGYKERRITQITQLYNKLSADETNNFKDKINEIIGFVNTIIPVEFLELRLKFKGNGNTDLGLQVGDIVHGFADADTIWNNAIYLGGDVTDRASYQPIYEQNPLVILGGGLVLVAPQQSFELPDGATCQNVFANESLVTHTTNAAFVARWQQAGDIVTTSKLYPVGTRIVIQYSL